MFLLRVAQMGLSSHKHRYHCVPLPPWLMSTQPETLNLHTWYSRGTHLSSKANSRCARITFGSSLTWREEYSSWVVETHDEGRARVSTHRIPGDTGTADYHCNSQLTPACSQYSLCKIPPTYDISAHTHTVSRIFSDAEYMHENNKRKWLLFPEHILRYASLYIHIHPSTYRSSFTHIYTFTYIETNTKYTVTRSLNHG